jgi:type VI secretion system secreted protein Hcp
MAILLNFEKAIKGDSTVSGHTDWITVDSFQWGVGRAISASGGGKDRDTSMPSFSEVSISKSMDVASTELWRQAVCGESLGKCTIDFIQTSGSDSKVQIYYQVILHDAIVSSFSSGSSGDRPHESLSISFTKVEHKYDTFSQGGTVTKGETKNWDLMAGATF